MQNRVKKTRHVGFSETLLSSIPWVGIAPVWPMARREEMQKTESAPSACKVARVKITRRSLGCASSASSVCLSALYFCGLILLVGFVAFR